MNETVTIDGVDAVLRRHHGRGPTLVLLHGAGYNHHLWDGLLRDLGGLDVVLPSLPGRCGSAGAPLQTVPEMARWLGALLGKLSLDRVVVGGHSLGGAVALEHALCVTPASRPELVGLVLLSSGARLRVMPSILEGAALCADSGMPFEAGRLAYRDDTSPELVERVEAMAALTPPGATLADWRAADAFDRMRDLGDVKVPVLVLGGTLDELTPPKYQRYLETHLPRARLELVERGGHMVPVERTHEVGRAIGDFVRDLGAAGEAAGPGVP